MATGTSLGLDGLSPTSQSSRPPRATLLSLPAECIKYIADYLTTTQIPDCLFEREQAWRTADVYPGSVSGSAQIAAPAVTGPMVDSGDLFVDGPAPQTETPGVSSGQSSAASSFKPSPVTSSSAIDGSTSTSSRTTPNSSSSSPELHRPHFERPRLQPTSPDPAMTSSDESPGLLPRLTVDVEHVHTEDSAQHLRAITSISVRSGPDSASTKRAVRRLAAVSRDLAAKLRPVLLRTTSITSQEQLDWFLARGRGDIHLIRSIRLTPLSHILSVDDQAALLQRIHPGQLRKVHLDMLPYLLARNVQFGYDPASDILRPIVSRIAALQISSLSLRTNTLGLAPSLATIKGLTEFTLEDAGVWDGADTSAYQRHVDAQHHNLAQTLCGSASTLETLVLRRKTNVRAENYGYLNFAAVLCEPPIRFPRLRRLELRRCAVEDTRLHTFLRAHPSIEELTFYPEDAIELPRPPVHLKQLYTNCHMPSLQDAVPPKLTRLCVSENGPVVLPPPQTFVPRLPGTLRTFHARLPPGTTEAQIDQLLAPMLLLEDVELLVKPLEWINCDCPPRSDAEGKDMPYLTAWRDHALRTAAMRPSWNGTMDFAALARILLRHEHVVSIAINHDHFTKATPFPDIRHNGRTALSELIPAWWQRNQGTLESSVTYLFERVPRLRIVRWRVCERHREAWAIWERAGDGLAWSAMLLVEQEA